MLGMGPNTQQPAHNYVSAGAAAKLLQCDITTVRRWADEGKLRDVWRTPGNQRRFSVQELQALQQGGQAA